MRLSGLLLVLVVATRAEADPRRIPFWPDPVPAAIQKQIDAAYIYDAVRTLGHHHRVQGSPGFHAAATWLVGELTAAKLADIKLEAFPADGKTTYGHFKSYLGWAATEARLEKLSPTRQVIADLASSPFGLADYSQDADVTAELVDVGEGVEPAAYQGKNVRGKIVLATGRGGTVHRLAVEERGAVGIVSDASNDRTGWSDLDLDQVRWGHLSAYKTGNKFGFMISKRAGAALRQELARGVVRLQAHVRAKVMPASYEVVSATITGTDAAAGEIVITAHLCHPSPAANDNASGSATALGVARALQAAITSGSLPRPKRTIRFLWVPEISGSQAWLVSHPDLAKRLRAGIHLDMVGGRPAKTHATLHLSRSPESLPHVINEISNAWVADVARRSTAFAELGEGDGLVWPTGDRDPLVTDVRPFELGSDHEVFAAFGVPMVYFHDWPDSTIHTNKDVPDNLDPTKLGRVAYMTAGIAWTLAALPDNEAAKLPALDKATTDRRLADTRHAALADGRTVDDARLAERETIAIGVQELDTIATLWPTTRTDVRKASATLAGLLPRGTSRPGDSRVPERLPSTIGPLRVYYYDHLETVLGNPVPKVALDETLAYEALNLVDGKRSVSEIRDLLAGRYQPVSLADVTAWFDLLGKAGVVRLRAR